MLDYQIQDDIFYNKAFRGLGAQLKFAWLPQTCYISGKLIWLKFGYRITAMWTGPGNPVFEHRWHEKNAHIMWMLKR